jgi:predicted AlkP superfamily pyrophosphatase or phosphodiesterase
MALFFLLLLLFYISEFTIFSSIPGSSTLKLISQREVLGGPKKVILVVIDALRYDYIERLPFISAALDSKPAKTFLAKCKVGNPTMTTQRIESLMTGSEIFSSTTILKSFFASRTSTDSIIHQLNLQNRTSFVMGDDTWVKLFSFSGS